MEVGKSSHANSKRSSFTQSSCPDEDLGEESHLGEDSQLEYLSAHEEYVDDKNSSGEFSEQREIGEAKDVLLVGDEVPPQIATEEEVSGKHDRHIHGVSVKPSGPSLSPRQRVPAVVVQFCEPAESSASYSSEKPAVCPPGTSSTAKDAGTQFPASETLTSKNPAVGVEVAADSPRGSASCVSSEHPGTLKTRAGVSLVTQVVDASSDFRACFTTSRSSTAQVCLCSRAINTEITMMNKSRPVGWPRQNCVDAASNTEWSFGPQSSHVQEQWESKLCTCDWKMGTDRAVHLNKQTMKNSVSSCFQNALQRATEAELQLLAVHYKMCYQHCLTVYQLALEENTCFARCDEKSELYSSLLLVLEELEHNYNNMKAEISMGVPLNALPPLSVEVKLPPLSSFYVPSKFFRKCLGSDSLSGEEKADFEAPDLQEEEISVSRDKTQSEGGQPADSASPKTWEGQHKGRDLKCGHMKTEEGTEYWFDAKEDLTLSDFPVAPEETKKQQEKQGTGDVREAKTVQSKNEPPSVPVGDPSSSVSECPDLKSPTEESVHSLVRENQKDTGENSVQKTSASYTIDSSDIFNSPYALNLSSFTKLINRLQSMHPEASRDKIVEALQQVRKNNKGMLCGLSISTIEERTSAILRKSMPSCGQEKQ